MSNPKKALGAAFEDRVVRRARALGLEAARQPGSGTFKDYPNDVTVAGLLGECKVRSRPPSLAQMERWLAEAEANAAKAAMPGAFLVYNAKGGRHPLVLLGLDCFLALLNSRKGAET